MQRTYLQLVDHIDGKSVQGDQSYQFFAAAGISQGMGQDHGSRQVAVAHDQGHVALSAGGHDLAVEKFCL
jgi:hypothetical protein